MTPFSVVMEEIRDLENNFMQFNADFDTQKATWDDIIHNMEKDLAALEEKHRLLHQEANDLEALVDDKQRDIDAMKKRKQELENSIKRMEKDILKYEDQMLLIFGEITKLESMVFAAEAELKKLIAQNAEAERAKRATVENLKQQIAQLKQEIQSLNSKYEADLEDLNEVRNITAMKKEQFDKLIEEQNEIINDRTKKVNRLDTKNKERLATVESLQNKLEKLREDRASTEDSLNTQIKEAQLKLAQLNELKEQQDTELEFMRTDTVRLNGVMKDLETTAEAMKTAGQRYDARLAELEEIYNEASKQLKWRKEIENELQTRLVTNRTNTEDMGNQHVTNVNRRNGALQLITECLAGNMYYNTYLSRKYRLKQSELNETRTVFSNGALEKSVQKLKQADAQLTARFLRMFEQSNTLTNDVRREFCKVHQNNLDCKCCRHVRDIRNITVTMEDEATMDGEVICETCERQNQLRLDAQLPGYKNVKIDYAKKLVAKPPISLKNC